MIQMTKRADLHVHTSASDGIFNPSQVICLAKQHDINTIAITDHDTMDGLDEAIYAGKVMGVEVIPGIEISADFESEMHILGYYIERKNYKLCEFIKDNKKKRKAEMIRAINNLIHIGIKLNLREIKKEYGKISIGTIINTMIKLKYISNQQEGYDLYFGKGKIAYVGGVKLNPYRCIKLIKDAGGISVLAHLHRISTDSEKIASIVQDLKEHGLDGLECYYPTYTEMIQEQLVFLAKRNKLVITGGSDFHGDSECRMGRCANAKHIPYYVVENLKTALTRDRIIIFEEKA